MQYIDLKGVNPTCGRVESCWMLPAITQNGLSGFWCKLSV